MIPRRRILTGLTAITALPFAPAILRAQSAPVSFWTAGKGSAFLPYGEGLAKVLGAAGMNVAVTESKGSNENLDRVDADPAAIGTAFIGSAFEAMTGTAFAAGKPHSNLRALWPMYETSFQVAALTRSGLKSIADLDGKRVGTGPANGPAEGYFRALAEVARIKPIILSGTPDAQAKALITGDLDAFWQGAIVPIPSLTAVTSQADAVVFGLSNAEVAAMRQRFVFMTEAAIAPGTYKGQTSALKSISAWNVVVAHKDLPDATAYAMTKAVLSATGLKEAIGDAAARGTQAANAVANTVVPFHPGAARALKDLGITVKTG